MGVELLIRSIDAGAIRPTYGANLDFILFGWLQAFQNHEDAFGNISCYITRENVLHLRCPVVAIGADLFPVAVDIRLPPRFPESDPQCKLVNKNDGSTFPRGALPIQHPAVSAYDYQIDLKKLAAQPGVNLPLKSFSPNQGVPSLIQILASISNLVNDALEPVVQPPPPPPIAASSSQPQHQQQQNTYRDPNTMMSRPNNTVVYHNSTNSAPHSASSASLSITPAPVSPVTATTASVIQGVHLGPPSGSGTSPPPPPKEIVEAVSNRVKEFFEQREAALKTLGHLQGSEDTLQRLLKSLNHKKETLADANQEVTQMGNLCDQVVKAKPSSALKCIEASDPLSAQGFALLAEVQACDDVMEALEKRLRTAGMKNNNNNNGGNDSIMATGNSFALGASASVSTTGLSSFGNGTNNNESATTNYLRLVGNLARRQFMAKFLLRKVQGKRLASRSLTSLINRFPALDPSVISAVLESNAYDAAATAQRLTEMTRV